VTFFSTRFQENMGIFKKKLIHGNLLKNISENCIDLKTIFAQKD